MNMLLDPILWALFALTGLAFGASISKLVIGARARRYARMFPFRSVEEELAEFGAYTHLTTVRRNNDDAS